MNDTKTSLYKTLSLFVLVLTVVTIYCVLWGPGQKWSASLHPARTLVVSASGDVDAVPDIATLSFSVVSEGPDTERILSENNQNINDAIAMLVENGVVEQDIKTAQYNLVPIYTQAPSSGGEIFVPSIASYRVTQTVEAKIRSFEDISSIMTELPILGINRINGLSFSVEDDETYLSLARDEAFSKAREKAETIASQNKVRLGRVVSVSEYSSPIYAEKSFYGLGGGGDSIVAPRIEPGTQDVSVNVSVVYELR